MAASATIGSFNRLDLAASLSGPITDNIFAGVAFSRKRQDGYGRFRDFFADNPDLVGLEAAIAGITVFDERTGALLSGNSTGLAPGSLIAGGRAIAFPEPGERPGNENNWSARGTLVWEPSSDFTITIAGDYADADETAPALVLLDVFADDLSQPGGGPNPVTGNDFAPNLVGLHNIFGFEAATTAYNNENFVIGDNFSTYATGPGGSRSEVWGISGTIEASLSDALSLKSITAYRDLDSVFGQDPDHSPFVLDAHTNIFEHQQFSQELQVLFNTGILNGVLGAYYFEEQGVDQVVVPLLHGLAALDQTNSIDNEALAFFAQVTVEVGPYTNVTGGIRYTDETKTYDQVHLDCGIANALMVAPGFVVNNCNSLSTGVATADFSNVSYLISLDHRFSSSALVYASISTGFKSGGFTGRTTAFQPNQTPLPFDEESATNFELGAKFDFDFGRINLALFQTDFDDLQLVIQQGVAPVTTNAASARIRGVEAEILLEPTDGLRFNLAGSYLDASYRDPPPFPIGPELANTPEFSLNGGIEYEMLTGGSGGFTARVDGTFKTEIFNNAENTAALLAPSVFLLNASLTWEDSSERYSVTVGGRNITDEVNLITGFFQPGVGYTEGVFNRPAEWYLSLGFRY